MEVGMSKASSRIKIRAPLMDVAWRCQKVGSVDSIILRFKITLKHKVICYFEIRKCCFQISFSGCSCRMRVDALSLWNSTSLKSCTMKLKTIGCHFSRVLFACCLVYLSACGVLKKEVDRVDVDALLRRTQPELDSLAIQAGRSATIGASEKAYLISQNLIQGLKGVTDTLDPDIRKIMRTIDSLGNLTDAQLVQLGETLETRLNRLKDSIKDEDLKKFLIGAIEEMTGKLRKETRYLLSDMIQASLDSLGTASSKEKIRLIIRDILGDSTQRQAQLLIQGALQPTIDTILRGVDRIVNKDVPFVQKQASKLLILLALLAAGIIGFVWYQRTKYAKLVSLLTYEIDKIPSQATYDELTHKIKNEAQKTGLEPLLRETLKEQGINP